MEARIGQLLEHARWVRGLARCLTHDDASADDLAQDAWVAALRNPPAIAAEPRGWLGAVVRNTRRMALRADGRRVAREQAAIDPDVRVESAADLSDEVELGRVLAEELLALDEPYRETLLLTFYRDLSSSEIGARRGVPAATVRSHVRLGLDRLRGALDRRYGERATWQRALVPLVALPRLATQGAPAMKIALAFSAAAVVGVGATSYTRHQPQQPVTRASPAQTALRKRITTLEQAKPGHDVLRTKIEAHRPSTPVPRAEPPTATSPSDVGGLDPDYIRAAIADALPLFQGCFEAALVDHANLAGRVVLDFTIEGDPDVGGIVAESHVDADKSTLHEPELVQCFEESIYGARFPAPTGNGAVNVSYPFVLAQPDEQAKQ